MTKLMILIFQILFLIVILYSDDRRGYYCILVHIEFSKDMISYWNTIYIYILMF